MYDIYLLKFENYFNRHIKRFETINEYLPYLVRSNVGSNPQTNITLFKWNDFINTKQVINNWSGETPNYLLVVENGSIIARFFVLECNYISSLKYELTLRRDIIADNLKDILNSTCLIHKGFIEDNNPLIYNNEPGISGNQIKKQEVLLKSKLGCPWLIAYLARKDNGGLSITYQSNFNTADYVISGEYDFESLYPFSDFFNKKTKVWDSGDIGAICETRHSPSIFTTYKKYKAILRKENQYTSQDGEANVGYPVYRNPFIQLSDEERINRLEDLRDVWNAGTGETIPYDRSIYKASSTIIKNLLAENNKIYKIGDKLKRVEVKIENEGLKYVRTAKTTSTASSVDLVMLDILKAINGPEVGMEMHNFLEYNGYDVSIGFSDDLQAGGKYNYNFDYSTKSYTSDSPYEIVAIPYGDLTLNINEIDYNYTKDLSMAFISSLGEITTCYDIQMVPYLSTQLDDNIILTKDPINILMNKEIVCQALRLDSSNYNYLGELNEPLTIRNNIKLSCSVDKYRIVSPGGGSDFEFSPHKNGSFKNFEVDITLIPYNPYIKVSPIWSNLYGSDFNDYRGLILNANDLQLPRVTNEWRQYQLNNRNFQNSFKRQIETMDKMNEFNLWDQLISTPIAAAGAGATTGVMTSNAALGGITGGLSLVGGIADIAIGQQRFKRTREDAIAQHNFDLGNIKARPESLSRSTSINYNNKLFPYVEYYTCTDKEYDQFTTILKNRGMTIGVIGSIINYLNLLDDWTYIKADLVEYNTDIGEDAHYLEEINSELNRGVKICQFNNQ